MQHTPQQRRGGPRYGAGVLIGGFYEDDEQRRSTMKAFLAKQGAGELKSTKWQERMAVAMAPVQLSCIRDDGLVHFGDVVQLAHAPTGCSLAVNVHDRDASCEDSCSACATQPSSSAPVARTTLLLSKYTPLRPSPLEPLWEDDTLRFGQKLHVVANPMARGEELEASGGSRPLYLASKPHSATCAAKFSRHQLVQFTEVPSYAAVWQVQPVDPMARGHMEGQPVRAGEPLLLVHCATQAPLCLEAGISFPTDFGVEHEVSAHLATGLGMQQGLERLARGDDLGGVPKRPLELNHWTFVSGTMVGQLPQGEGPLYDIDALLEHIAADVAARPGGLDALDRKLNLLCDKRGDIEAGELLLLLKQCGASSVGEMDVCKILAEYVGSRPGHVAGRVLVAAVLQQAAALADSRGHNGGR